MTDMPIKPRLSVMVLTRNRLPVLRNCVRSILVQRFHNFEIVILDDASDSEDTAAAVAAEFNDPRIRPYRVEACLGVAGGRNFLMDQSRGEILVSIDDDAIFVDDNALGEVCNAFEREREVAIVAFRINNIIDGKRTPFVPLRRSAISRDPKAILKRVPVVYFLGCGHAIRKWIIDEYGGYRDDLVFAGEEWDVAYRVIRAGYQIIYEPSVEVDHYPLPSVVAKSKSAAASEVFYQIRNHAYLAYRYLPWRYVIPYMGAWTLRCALRSFREENILSLIRGVAATPRFLRSVKREVLDQNSLIYLAAHGGGRGTIY